MKLTRKTVYLILALLIFSLLFGCDYQDLSFPNRSNPQASDFGSEESSSKHEGLTVHFIDVGQGDSTFIELPNGETMLIDAGEATEGDKVVTYIFSQGYDTVNYVVATHPHSDHIGGIPDILNNFVVDDFYLTTAKSSSKCFSDMMNAINENNVNTHYVAAGDVILSNNDLLAEVVAPQTVDTDNLNDTSVVIKMTYMDNRFLFSGDAEKSEEDNIWTNIKCDVLKVGHHGSSTSTSRNFLKKAEPQYAIISAGLNNSYGHPAEETLNRLAERDIAVYRTDLQGTIIFNSNGSDITVNKDPVNNPKTIENGDFKSEYTGEYVLNTKSKKIHYPDCPSVNSTKDSNKEYTNDFKSAIAQGYTPCQSCNPT